MRVLVVDDDPVSRLQASRTLSGAGHDVVALAEGRSAWETLEREPVPLVVADWMMPELDGLELCRRVRAAEWPHYTYLIVVTSLAGLENALEGMRAGADDFLTKPVDPRQLLARVRVAERVLSLQAEIKQLTGLLPTCMYCKRIRDETGAWSSMERYISTRTEATFSHGICPECRETRVQPELDRVRRLRGLSEPR